MTVFGYFLSSEEHPPRELVRQAEMAQQAGFKALWISDHFHPWNDAQGQSPFVWTTIGAILQATDLPVTTAVTCPTFRIHPAVIAQAAATCAALAPGRFRLGVGSGEALNEHILGDRWPETGERLEMLEEAISVMRRLWSGEEVSHAGQHYRVVNARIYTLPEEPIEVLMSGFGEASTSLAGRVADGYISTRPDPGSLATFRAAGGEGKTTQGGVKVCWDPSEEAAVSTVHRLWANQQLPGQLAQELALPALFEQASQLVDEQMITDSGTACGPDLGRHVKAIRAYVDAGFDEVYVGQIGPRQESFFEAYGSHVLPELQST